MIRSTLLSIVLLGLTAGACTRPAETVSGAERAARDTADVSVALPVVRLQPEPYSFTYNSGLVDSARLVVRDGDRWSDVWRQIHRNRGSVPPAPSIDFAREMVVVAALGTRPSGGFSIFVDSAYAAGDDGALVVVRSESPGPRCGVTAALTEPVDVARLPRRAGPVEFRERRSVHECP